MGIKKVNREELLRKAAAVPVQTASVAEELNYEEEIYDEEVVDEVVEEKVIEEKPATVKQPVKKQTVTKTQTVKTNKKEVKGETKMSTTKKSLGGKKANKSQEERVIGTVYPKDLLMKNIQGSLEERFEGVSLADVKAIFDVVEDELLKACQVSSVRFMGGILKAQDRNALVAKAPKVDYSSYTAPRKVVTITNAELGQPDKYRGQVSKDGKQFEVSEMYNYETGKWEEAEGTIDL